MDYLIIRFLLVILGGNFRFIRFKIVGVRLVKCLLCSVVLVGLLMMVM